MKRRQFILALAGTAAALATGARSTPDSAVGRAGEKRE